MADEDWFQQNAPQQEEDWFAKNAPKPVATEERSIPSKIGHAVVDTLKSFVPQSFEEAALAPVKALPGVGKVGTILSNIAFGKPIAEGLDPLAGIPVVQRIPQIIEAEKTPAGSQERFTTAAGTLLDLGMIAGLKAAPEVAAKPKLAEVAGIERPSPTEPVTPETPIAATEPIEPIAQPVQEAVTPPTAQPLQETVPEVLGKQEPVAPNLPTGTGEGLSSQSWYRGHVEGQPIGQTETFVSSTPEQAAPFASQVGGKVSEIRFNREPNVYPEPIPWDEYQRHWKNSALLKGYDAVRVIEPNGQAESLAVRNPDILEPSPVSEAPVSTTATPLSKLPQSGDKVTWSGKDRVVSRTNPSTNWVFFEDGTSAKLSPKMTTPVSGNKTPVAQTGAAGTGEIDPIADVAVKTPDGKVHTGNWSAKQQGIGDADVMFEGFRDIHSGIHGNLERYYNDSDLGKSVWGYTTESGKFLNKEEAFKHAQAIKQVNAEAYKNQKAKQLGTTPDKITQLDSMAFEDNVGEVPISVPVGSSDVVGNVPGAAEQTRGGGTAGQEAPSVPEHAVSATTSSIQKKSVTAAPLPKTEIGVTPETPIAEQPKTVPTPAETHAASNGENPIGIAERYREEQQPGSVIPGIGRTADEARSWGHDFINKGGNPYDVVANKGTKRELWQDVGVVRAEYERLSNEKRAAESAWESNPDDPELKIQFEHADAAQRQWSKDAQPVLTRAGDALRAASRSYPREINSFSDFTDIVNDHFKGEVELTPEKRAELQKAVKAIRKGNLEATEARAQVTNEAVKRAGGKVLSFDELKTSLTDKMTKLLENCAT